MITLTIEGGTRADVLAQLEKHYLDFGGRADATTAAVPFAPAPVTAQSPSVFPTAAPVPYAPVTPTAPTMPAALPTPATPAPAPVVPTQAPPTYTADELMRAAVTLMDGGKGPQLQQLMATMGVQHFGQLHAERYGEFALALKEMGAKL